MTEPTPPTVEDTALDDPAAEPVTPSEPFRFERRHLVVAAVIIALLLVGSLFTRHNNDGSSNNTPPAPAGSTAAGLPTSGQTFTGTSPTDGAATSTTPAFVVSPPVPDSALQDAANAAVTYANTVLTWQGSTSKTQLDAKIADLTVGAASTLPAVLVPDGGDLSSTLSVSNVSVTNESSGGIVSLVLTGSQAVTRAGAPGVSTPVVLSMTLDQAADRWIVQTVSVQKG
jgi:hypothetical protein